MANQLQKALELSRALFDPDFELRCQHFSFAFYKGRIMAVGRNQNKTHTLNLRNPLRFNDKVFEQKRMCSELSLFLTLKNKTNIPFHKISIINIRLDRNAFPCMSRPCESCRNLIKYLKPKELFYTDERGEFLPYLA